MHRKQLSKSSNPTISRKADQDALALAEVIYDIFKDKKRRENDKMLMDQNNAKPSNN